MNDKSTSEPTDEKSAGARAKVRPPVTLETPIVRGGSKIETLDFRKPKSGEMRGLNMNNIGTGDVDTYIKLLPRITVPPITEQEAEALDPADMAQCYDRVTDFLLTKAQRASLGV